MAKCKGQHFYTLQRGVLIDSDLFKVWQLIPRDGNKTFLLQRRLAVFVLCVAASVAQAQTSDTSDDPGFVENLIARFRASDINLDSTTSNQPFFPVAYVNASSYSDTHVEAERGVELDYDIFSVSQAAGLPILLGKRDMLVVGEYINYSRFNVDSEDVDDFNVTTYGLPVGWLRQVNHDWQVAAFVMPMLHHTDRQSGVDSWQTMGGVFSRYVQSDYLWWAFGFYFDHATDGDLYLPYVGASWAVTEEWTISAVMPWPSVSWAPNKNFFVRLGASPSGASWSVESDEGDVAMNLDGWDFGLGAGKRLTGDLWIDAEAGIGGLRGFRFNNSNYEEADFSVSSNPYVSLSLEFRPEDN